MSNTKVKYRSEVNKKARALSLDGSYGKNLRLAIVHARQKISTKKALKEYKDAGGKYYRWGKGM